VAVGAIGAAWWLFVRTPDERAAPPDARPPSLIPAPVPDAALDAPAPARYGDVWPAAAVSPFDPRRFDPLAFLPRALAEVAKTVPDAKLDDFTAENVATDGTCDLTERTGHWSLTSPSVQYNFHRASALDARPGAPCNYHLVFTKDGAGGEVGIDIPERCGAKTAPPRCSLGAVLSRVARDHKPSGRRTDRVAYTFGEWAVEGFYELTPAGTTSRIPHEGVADWITVKDDCPPQ
jgi:hypothetical protein